VNRSVMSQRLKLQNELIQRDLEAIDVPAFEKMDVDKKEAKTRGQRKAKSGQ